MEQVSILFVDDDEGLLTLHRLVLKTKSEFDVRTALTGQLAIEQARQHRPDLVILDLMLPDMSGIEVCQYMRAQPAWANMPIVVLTGLGTPEARQSALGAGANEVWLKPLTPSELVAKIRHVLEQYPG